MLVEGESGSWTGDRGSREADAVIFCCGQSSSSPSLPAVVKGEEGGYVGGVGYGGGGGKKRMNKSVSGNRMTDKRPAGV